MNDFSDLETELKKLRPAAPSADLIARVERSLGEPLTATPSAGILPKPQRPGSRFNWFALGLGGAVAATFLLLARTNVDRATPKTAPVAANTPIATHAPIADADLSFVPENLTRVVYNTRNEGLLFPRNAEQPMRRVRSQSRETLQWKDAGTGASLRVSYPTDEVQLIPISGQ